MEITHRLVGRHCTVYNSLVGLSTKTSERGSGDTADYANMFPKNPSAEVLLSLRAAWKNVGLLIIDEISMVSRCLNGPYEFACPAGCH